MTALDVRYVDEKNTHRLLSSAYVDESAIAPLYDDEEEKAVLDALEARTSGRLMAQDGKLDELDPKELMTEAFGFGWTYVNAAFAYTRASGSRFNREGRGAWYAALAVETCIREIAFHLGRELKNTGETENRTKYVQLVAHIEGPMAFLQGAEAPACLDPDTAVGYPAGQEFAAEVLGKDLSGIRYPSVRDPDGICIAALKPRAVNNVTKGDAYLLTWSGGGGPDVTRV